MRKADCLLVPLFLLVTAVPAFAQTSPARTARIMRNADVIQMVEDGVNPSVIIANIFTSHCAFDVFPPVLRDLKRRGVPDRVLAAMKAAPYGPPALAEVDSKEPPPPPVTIPAGTIIEVESARAVTSKNSPPGTRITFVVSKHVYVDKVLVIDRGAVARGRVVKSKPARVFGRAGMLAWEMDYVVGVDGTRIPIQLEGKQTGTNRMVAIAGGAVATGALVFPYSSPVALIWGLKKGEEAVLRGSRVFNARVTAESEIAGFQPRPEGVVYRDRETVKASTAPPTNTNFEKGSFKPKGSLRPN
jgi:hypothetical protein